MKPLEQWIWLPKEKYSQYQTTIYNPGLEFKDGNYVITEFKKQISYSKKISIVKVRFSADTAVSLYCNEQFVGRGPASAGGDFLWPYVIQPQYYAYEETLTCRDYPNFCEGKVDFRAVVRMTSSHLFEHSLGKGGFYLTAYVFFEDGTKDVVITDTSWQARVLNQYKAKGVFDNSPNDEDFSFAEKTNNIWHCETAPIPVCYEEYSCLGEIVLDEGESRELTFLMDKIYAGYPVVKLNRGSDVKLVVHCREWREQGSKIDCFFKKPGEYYSSEMHSAGELEIQIENKGNEACKLEIGFIKSHFPVAVQAKTETSDSELNAVLDTCAHTLKYCRQTLHLDSPRHCELLACTGDYYIESLMTSFTFGDQRLSAFYIMRTAELLRYRDGEMFHVTYSLIWVQMLWDVYMLTGDKTLLSDCEDALHILFKRFRTYLGENGLIETPPSFMFVDWLFPDNISLHHPPKALGQTCLNMFYFGALKTAEKIFNELNLPVNELNEQREKLKKAMLDYLYDEEKELFFEGLNTPTPEHLLGDWMPQNVEKRYYRMHSNILAAYFGFFEKEKCRNLLRRLLDNDDLGKIQPYFCHYLLEAIYRNDLREEYTISVLEQWKEPVRECSKGLAEGFYKPEPTYEFDHSHAWGGTPVWSLPLALSGMEIKEAGMKKLKFNPSLLGLDFATVEIPTPNGILTIRMKKGEEPVISAPQGIEIEV